MIVFSYIPQNREVDFIQSVRYIWFLFILTWKWRYVNIMLASR